MEKDSVPATNPPVVRDDDVKKREHEGTTEEKVIRVPAPSFEQLFAYRSFQPTLAFSADGSRLLFSSNISGQFNLWDVDVAGGWPRQLTPFTDSTVRVVAVRTRDDTIAFTADVDGNENYQVWSIDAGAGWPDRRTDAREKRRGIFA